MIDKDYIQKEIEELQNALGILEKHSDIDISVLEKDIERRWIVERGLIVVMQSVFNIAAHILASHFKNDWDDYFTLIGKMGDHDVLPKEFTDNFRKMSGFRNILIHEYDIIDLEVVQNVMNNDLEDFKKFISYIQNFVHKL